MNRTQLVTQGYKKDTLAAMGYGREQLVGAGLLKQDYEDMDYSKGNLRDLGFTLSEMLAAGWNNDHPDSWPQ